METYLHRLAALKLDETATQRRHIQLGYLRLLIGLAVVACIFLAHWFVLPAVIAFALAARAHEAVLRRLAATRRRVVATEHAVARVEDRWIGLRPRTTRVDRSQSLYADDLDLFGPGSLFELLCDARTSLGEDTLAHWLLHPASRTDILARQAAVEDLRDRPGLREAFAGARGPQVAELDAQALGRWAEGTTPSLPTSLQWLAPCLVVLTGVAAWRSVALHTWLPLGTMVLVNASILRRFQGACRTLFAELQDTQRKLATTADLFHALQQEVFQAPATQALGGQLRTKQGTAADALQRLAVLATWAEARKNYIVRILDPLLLYSIQTGLRIQRWNVMHGTHLRLWLQSLGEFEALLSLGAYSYEHPEDRFPQILEGGSALLAKGLAHPLLSSKQAVRNDVTLTSETRLLLISGSNMSGKSTLLRAVGINAVLAFMGAPVRAESLALSPLTLAASIQVQDSLQAGRSRFYAEILRLRGVTEAARRSPPALFLLDELLAGTNSSDRLAGAEAIVRDLLHSGAIGLLTTHDLALTSIVATAEVGVRNAHFEDQITGDELIFDYKLREGVVERSNGLALMRLVGLDV